MQVEKGKTDEKLLLCSRFCSLPVFYNCLKAITVLIYRIFVIYGEVIKMPNTTKNPVENCGVDEEVFPCMGKCCRKKDDSFMSSYEIICPYCDISASLPCGASLKTVTVFECRKYGYGKRVTG